MNTNKIMMILLLLLGGFAHGRENLLQVPSKKLPMRQDRPAEEEEEEEEFIRIQRIL